MSKKRPQRERVLSCAKEIPDPDFAGMRLEALERRALQRAAERERFARNIGAAATQDSAGEKEPS